MPQKRISAEPPKVMTWKKASMVLIVAGLFDLLRMFFEMFWFFGPAMAALYCTAQTSDFVSTVTSGALGVKTAAAFCTGAAAYVGTAVVEFTTPFGVVMAMATGLIAFLVLGLWILITNARVFTINKSGPILFTAGFGISIIPLIGTLPAFSLVLWRLYSVQIHKEKEALHAYEKARAEEERRTRQQQSMEFIQNRNAQIAYMEEQEAANDTEYDEEEENEEIPDDAREAA